MDCLDTLAVKEKPKAKVSFPQENLKVEWVHVMFGVIQGMGPIGPSTAKIFSKGKGGTFGKGPVSYVNQTEAETQDYSTKVQPRQYVATAD